MEIELVSGSSCSSVWKVGEHVLRLWIIVGGTPALAFEDYGFEKRYQLSQAGQGFLEEWNPMRRLYPHQFESPIKWPTPDVLPNGEQDMLDFVAEYACLARTRETRRAMAGRSIRSGRFHDEACHTYFYCEVSAGDAWYIGPVTAHSAVYAGRLEDTIHCYASDPWKRATNLLNPIFDKSNGCGWEAVNDTVFQEIMSCYAELRGVNKEG